MAAADWSPDDKKILLEEELSINESYLWLVDAATGEKTELTPRNTSEKVSYGQGRFSKDGKGFTSRRTRIRNFTGCPTSIWQRSSAVPHDEHSVGRGVVRPYAGGKDDCVLTNEEGVSVVHVMTHRREGGPPAEAAGGSGGLPALA